MLSPGVFQAGMTDEKWMASLQTLHRKMGARTICQEGHGTAVPHAHHVKKGKGALPISRGGLEGPLPCGAGEAGWGRPSRKPLLRLFPCPVKS
jgi:hypothetical protein